MRLSFLLKLKAYYKLGVPSVVSVAAYRIACKAGVYRLLLPIRSWASDELFFSPQPLGLPALSAESKVSLLERADELCKGNLCYFSGEVKQVGSPPDWFLDPFSGKRFPSRGHWSAPDDFSFTDIKIIWEPSRFEWAPLLARAWRISGERCYLDSLNHWVLNWVTRNPINCGPNWKCGQETAIRMINLILTSYLLGTYRSPSPGLVSLIEYHCLRIRPTLQYALAQNNNHGTSEAAALYVAGSWLIGATQHVSIRLKKQAMNWRSIGRRLLEERVIHLVAADGSFSQYSVNYHRVLLDTLCQVELWRQELGDKQFTREFLDRCCASVQWLAQLTDPTSGDAPNLGANDGARLYDLSNTPFRDFRSTVQLASVLFRKSRVYDAGSWDEPLQWLGRKSDHEIIETGRNPVMHDQGGDVVLHGKNCYALVRYARFRFRPSQADCFHFDLWHNGLNILRDGGTYSYNANPQWLDYFSGGRSHNTIQFDDRNQMPRIGQFLFGEWLSLQECSRIEKHGESLIWKGAYKDWQKAWHRRTVTVKDNCWKVQDEIDGFKERAVLRWRLIPDRWHLEDNACCGNYAKLHFVTDAPVTRLELVSGWESLLYQMKTPLPVIELEVPKGRWSICTEITLKS